MLQPAPLWAITITALKSFQIVEWHCNVLSIFLDEQKLELTNQNCNFKYRTQILSELRLQKFMLGEHTQILSVWELISQVHRTSVTQGFLAGILLCSSYFQ